MGKQVVPDATGLPAISKPVEIWSIVVKSCNKEALPKEIAQVVMCKVTPALGVRVHTVNLLNRGEEVALKVPSEKKGRSVVENSMFSHEKHLTERMSFERFTKKAMIVSRPI